VNIHSPLILHRSFIARSESPGVKKAAEPDRGQKELFSRKGWSDEALRRALIVRLVKILRVLIPAPMSMLFLEESERR